MTSEFLVTTAPGTVAKTVDSLKRILHERGIELFAEIDHGAGAAAAGLPLGGEILVIFGNPAVGTKLMQDVRLIGLDLPLRILVWSEDGTTKIGYSDPRSLADRYELGQSRPVLDALAALLHSMADELATA
jgi:uncharacterized protein (DUF302 family)